MRGETWEVTTHGGFRAAVEGQVIEGDVAGEGEGDFRHMSMWSTDGTDFSEGRYVDKLELRRLYCACLRGRNEEIRSLAREST